MAYINHCGYFFPRLFSPLFYSSLFFPRIIFLCSKKKVLIGQFWDYLGHFRIHRLNQPISEGHETFSNKKYFNGWKSSNSPAAFVWPEWTVCGWMKYLSNWSVWNASVKLKTGGLLYKMDFCSINAIRYKCKG